jgi:hypothetical protein
MSSSTLATGNDMPALSHDPPPLGNLLAEARQIRRLPF